MEDINPHYEIIRQWVGDLEEDFFKERMSECVADGTAFKVGESDCFLYYKKKNRRMADGIAMYGKGQPLKMLALICGIFTVHDRETFILQFKLHVGKIVDEYKSMITRTSIKRSMTGDAPLTVRVDKLGKKLCDLSEARGERWVL